MKIKALKNDSATQFTFLLRNLSKWSVTSQMNVWFADMFPLPGLGQLHQESLQKRAKTSTLATSAKDLPYTQEITMVSKQTMK